VGFWDAVPGGFTGGTFGRLLGHRGGTIAIHRSDYKRLHSRGMHGEVLLRTSRILHFRSETIHGADQDGPGLPQDAPRIVLGLTRSTDSTKSAVWNSANGMPRVPGGSWVGSWGFLKVRKHGENVPKFDPNQARKSGQIYGNPLKSMEIMMVFRIVPYVKSVKRD
jgi:hypothetical protein